jgi:hypothetical protein
MTPSSGHEERDAGELAPEVPERPTHPREVANSAQSAHVTLALDAKKAAPQLGAPHANARHERQTRALSPHVQRAPRASGPEQARRRVS